jgi:hypothetical protein
MARRLFSSVSIFCLCLTAVPAASYAQSGSADSIIPKDFLALADLRGATNVEIGSLERQVRELQDTLEPSKRQAQQAAAYIPRGVKDSAELARKAQRTPSEEEKLGYTISSLERARTDLEAPGIFQALLTTNSAELAAKKTLAGKVQARIAALLNPEQEFKRTMSITFAILIGFVIIGFFALAFKDPGVRNRVFGGQGGIQFLTLFSLVIAIILFGITGVLEGKELSALLGGLSGYILGRTMTPTMPPRQIVPLGGGGPQKRNGPRRSAPAGQGAQNP